MATRTNPYSLKVELNVETNAVDVTVREKNEKGDFVEVDSKSFDASAISADILTQVTLYGYSKLLQDRCSDIKAGPEKIAAMDEVAAQLAAGQWERERKAGAPTVSAEVEALAELKGCSVADIQKSLRKFTKEQKEKILGNEAIVKRATEIRAARETSVEVELESMLEV
jgi:hypothetical protein